MSGPKCGEFPLATSPRGRLQGVAGKGKGGQFQSQISWSLRDSVTMVASALGITL